MTGRFLDFATFLSLFIIAFQYFWNHFFKDYYKNRVRRKIKDEAKTRTVVERATRRVQWVVMVFLIAAAILAVIDIVGGEQLWSNPAGNCSVL